MNSRYLDIGHINSHMKTRVTRSTQKLLHTDDGKANVRGLMVAIL